MAVSVLCQKMARPTAGSWLRLKRVARYLKKYLVWLYEFWDDGEDLELKVTAIGRTTGIHVGAAPEVSPSWWVAP